MGNFALFYKKKSYFDELESIHKELEATKHKKQLAELSERKTSSSLFLYAVLTYVIAAAVYFYWLLPSRWLNRFLTFLPFVVLPLFYWGIRYLMKCYYTSRMISTDERLLKLKKRKTELLNEMKAKECYQKVREVLGKYGDDSFEESVHPSPAAVRTPISRTPQRKPSSSSRNDSSVNKVLSFADSEHSTLETSKTSISASLPRSLISPNRSLVDRILEVVLGDGPNNRYALICSNCLCHNGMAFPEEYPTLSYKCAFCGALNPAKQPKAAFSPEDSKPVCSDVLTEQEKPDDAPDAEKSKTE